MSKRERDYTFPASTPMPAVDSSEVPKAVEAPLPRAVPWKRQPHVDPPMSQQEMKDSVGLAIEDAQYILREAANLLIDVPALYMPQSVANLADEAASAAAKLTDARKWFIERRSALNLGHAKMKLAELQKQVKEQQRIIDHYAKEQKK